MSEADDFAGVSGFRLTAERPAHVFAGRAVSTRLANILRNNGIRTLKELRAIFRTPNGLRRLKNAGEVTEREVAQLVGLKFLVVTCKCGHVHTCRRVG